ncbi:hypothetical protein IWQ47_005296 [Aquimarina sp. EL_43]|nr:hypothetical protein [Aquimarina sp. EL_35]MBG6153959.1 hypothetical protein [Aquimarina sp. EL_32]MBG6172192.1 hypothetical protein [Aquimarina sp. EL_43]
MYIEMFFRIVFVLVKIEQVTKGQKIITKKS